MDDNKELLLTLIERAYNSEHIEIKKISSAKEYLGSCAVRKALVITLENLGYSANNIFTKYCSAVAKQQADVNLLLAYKKIQQAINFYEYELNALSDAITDYESYLCEGNFIKAFIFKKERS